MMRPGKEGGMASSGGGSDEEEVIGDLALRVMSRWKGADLQILSSSCFRSAVYGSGQMHGPGILSLHTPSSSIYSSDEAAVVYRRHYGRVMTDGPRPRRI